MKTETSEKEKKNIMNISKPEILDDFWKDCMDQKEKKYIKNNSNSKIPQKNNKLNIITENENQIKSLNNKNYINSILFEPHSKSNINISSNRNKNKKYLMKIYNKHPSFIEEIKNQEIKKIKSKNALNRCLGLYSYGLELQKNMKLNKENSENERKKMCSKEKM